MFEYLSHPKPIVAFSLTSGVLSLVFLHGSLANAEIAYLWPQGQAGEQAFSGSIGMDFVANVPINVSALGVFDHLGDGINGTLVATIWDLSTQQPVPGATATFTSGNPGVLNGSARMKPIQTITLPVGSYSIASAGHGDPDFDYNPAFNTITDDGGGVITITEVTRWAVGNVFPTNLGSGFFGGGTFEFSGEPPPLPPPATFGGDLVAYQVNAPQAGNQNFGGSLGMDFVVTSPIFISALGAFDADQNGMNADITVELWSRNDGGTPGDPADDSGIAILASNVFTNTDPGTLEGGSRFKSLDSLLELAPGAYTINAHGYDANELLANSGAIVVDRQTNDGDGLLEFVGTSRFCFAGGACTTFPLSPDAGPADRYAAGTFAYVAVPEPSSLVLLGFALSLLSLRRRRK